MKGNAMHKSVPVKLFCVFAVFILSCLPISVFAECDQTDPCAPKKTIGEWDKSLAFGLNLTSGNSETTLVSLMGAAGLERDKNLWDLSASYYFGEDKTNEVPGVDTTTRNDFRAAFAYKRLIDERWYGSGSVGFLYDEIADVDYRVTPGVSAGNFLLKDADFKLSLEAGPSYVFERVGGEDKNYFAPRIADRFDWIISCTSKVYQLAEILFDIEDSKNVLVNAEVGIEAAIATNLALVLSVKETFDNVPAEGRKKDDLIVTTALKVSL